MIVMKFTIELEIGLSFLLQSALPLLVTDRETKLIVVGGPSDRTAHCRRRTEIPEAEPLANAPPGCGSRTTRELEPGRSSMELHFVARPEPLM
jgi:hypothetical protein